MAKELVNLVDARKANNMAATKEELEKLKLKRSAAQTAFTRRANYLASRANALGENEMVGEWRHFKSERSKVRDAGFEYITALREAGDDHAEEMAVLVDGGKNSRLRPQV